FPEGYRRDVQVISMVLSVDPDASPQMAAMLGSSLALSVSDIPFEGPIAGVTVGLVDGKFIINPSAEEMENSDLDLQVAGTKDAVNMVESSSKDMTEDVLLEPNLVGHEEIKKLVTFEEEIVAEIQPEKHGADLEDDIEGLRSDIAEKVKSHGLYDAIQ